VLIKLHGTSGSGKTTAARELMSFGAPRYPLPIFKNRPEGYRVQLPDLKKPLFILGPYETTCGGLDALGEADDHIALLLKYGPQGHVFYEGLLQSGFYGRIGTASEQFGDDHVFAFLDTPLEVCLERVIKRREARGTKTAFNPDNTIDKYRAIIRLKYRLDHGDKCPVRKTAVINHRNPGLKLLDLYHASEQ